MTPPATDIGYSLVSLGRVRLVPAYPSMPTSQSVVSYQLETIASGGRPVETAEGGASLEADIQYTDTEVTAQRIPGIHPITDVELNDAPFIEALIGQRLGALIEARLERQILQGNGTTPNLRGFNGLANISTATAAYNATKLTRVNNMLAALASGAAAAEAATDAGQIDLWVLTSSHFWFLASAQDANSRLLFPSIADNPEATPNIFGITMVRSGGQEAATQILINLAYAELRMRQGLTVEIGLNGTDFRNYTRTVRGSIQAANVIRRPAAHVDISAPNS